MCSPGHVRRGPDRPGPDGPVTLTLPGLQTVGRTPGGYLEGTTSSGSPASTAAGWTPQEISNGRALLTHQGKYQARLVGDIIAGHRRRASAGHVPIDPLWHAVPAFPTLSEMWLRLLERERGVS